jgi:hypothetical protein
MVSFLEEFRQAKTEVAQRNADPLRHRIEAIVRGKEAIGTGPLLDLLGLPKTTGSARRIGETMRALGFVPIKSRRLMPGGYGDTVTRGWCRPVRELPHPNQQMEPRGAASVRSHDVAGGTVGGVK